ncbi:MAG: PKD domain-containing protein [Candidatus Thermoplasmatota archaeon]|nr:PKD domain-containing protein [Candidatus Thermoplasmatota archaeon]
MKKILCIAICMLMCVTTGVVAGTETQDVNPDSQILVQSTIQNRDMWDVQFNYPVGVSSGSLYLGGCGFDGTYFYAPEWNSATIYRFAKDGTYLDSFTIPGVSSLRDLAYDGTYFYGGNAAGLFLWQMDFTNHTLVSTINLPVASRSCAYDADNDGFWVNVWTTDLILYSRTGVELNRITAPESLYGSEWDGWTQIEGYEGPFIWVFTGTSTGVDGIIKAYDIPTKALTTTTHNVAQELGAGIAGGLFATELFETGTFTLGGICQGTTDDYLFGYELCTTNAPPETPGAPTGPASGTIGVSYSFSATTTDPEEEDVAYMFDWGDGTFSDWTAYVASGASGSASHSYPIPGDYVIKAKAKDINGGESDWSEGHTIAILDAPLPKVEWIKGGLFKVSASVTNMGGVAATNVPWTISLAGGAFIGKETTGTIASIEPGVRETIKSKFILGFGPTVITVTFGDDSKTQDAQILLFFIKI